LTSLQLSPFTLNLGDRPLQLAAVAGTTAIFGLLDDDEADNKDSDR